MTMPTSHAQGAFCILFMPRRRTTRAERDKHGDVALLATEAWRQAAGSGMEEQRGERREIVQMIRNDPLHDVQTELLVIIDRDVAESDHLL